MSDETNKLIMDVENDEDGLNIEGANINKVKLGFFLFKNRILWPKSQSNLQSIVTKFTIGSIC